MNCFTPFLPVRRRKIGIGHETRDPDDFSQALRTDPRTQLLGRGAAQTDEDQVHSVLTGFSQRAEGVDEQIEILMSV